MVRRLGTYLKNLVNENPDALIKVGAKHGTGFFMSVEQTPCTRTLMILIERYMHPGPVCIKRRRRRSQ